MRKLVSHIISAGLGLWLATLFIKGVEVTAYPDSNIFGIGITRQWQSIILLGIVLGLLNFFAKPIINLITLPLRLLTLGFSSVVVSMALIAIVDIIFKELNIAWWFPLLYVAFVIWGLNVVIAKILVKEED